MRSLWPQIFIIIGLLTACKKTDSSQSQTSDAGNAGSASVAVGMCDRVGGTTGEGGVCYCENGVAAFKLLGQTCTQMLKRQTSDCNSRNGQILYDDGKCRCFPNYDVLSAPSSCDRPFPQVSANSTSVVVNEFDEAPTGACVVLVKETAKPHDTCFEAVDLDGCARSFQVAFNQTKPDQYEMVFYPEKSCTTAKAAAAASPGL